MFANLRERLRGWKTVIWNGFLGLTPALLVAVDKLQAMDLTPYMTWYMAIAAGILVGAIGTWLRYVTTGPVGSKGEEAPAPDVKAGD